MEQMELILLCNRLNNYLPVYNCTVYDTGTTISSGDFINFTILSMCDNCFGCSQLQTLKYRGNVYVCDEYLSIEESRADARRRCSEDPNSSNTLPLNMSIELKCAYSCFLCLQVYCWYILHHQFNQRHHVSRNCLVYFHTQLLKSLMEKFFCDKVMKKSWCVATK